MKKFLVAVIFSLLLSSSVHDANAALVRFGRDGEAYWNVLGANSELEIKKLANETVAGKTAVDLTTDNGKVFLTYDGGKVDLTGYEEEIIEIEESEAPKKILISSTENGFKIAQSGIVAHTPFSIKINSPQNKLAVETTSGTRFLSIMPYDAVEQMVLTNIINILPKEGKIKLFEKDDGEIAYEVSGEKQIYLFNIFSFGVPITVQVSATSGKIINIDQPLWYSVVDFLLV